MDEQSRSLKETIAEKIEKIKTLEQRRKEYYDDMQLFFQQQKRNEEQYRLQAELAWTQRLRITQSLHEKPQRQHTDDIPQIRTPAWDLPTLIIASPMTPLPSTPEPFEMIPDPGENLDCENLDFNLVIPEASGERDLFQATTEESITTVYTAAHPPIEQERFIAFLAGAIQYHHECTSHIPDQIEMNPLLMLFLSSAMSDYSIGDKTIPFIENDVLQVDKVKCTTLPKHI